jgi:hypothetical protein
MSFQRLVQLWIEMRGFGLGRSLPCPAILLAVCLGITLPGRAQVVPAADQGGLNLSAGGTASGYYLNYGEQKLLGVSAFVDVDTRRHLSAEAEVRRLQFHNTNDVTVTTYLAGGRYFRNVGRFQIYAKFLSGFGHADLEFGVAQANSLVIAPGGGVDFLLNHRVHLRLADFEYQRWPQAVYGSTPSLASTGISSGIRIRVF